jgi:hypothetical protein
MFYRYEKVSIICCLNIIKLSVIFMFILMIIKEMKQTPNNVSSQIRFCRKMAIFANDGMFYDTK